MKKFSEFRDNLTSEQAGICSFGISFLLTLVFNVLLYFTFIHNIVTLLIISMFLVLAFNIFFNFAIFKTTTKKYNEGIAKAKQPLISKYRLTKDAFIEIRYIQEDFEHSSNMKMLTAVINNSDCKFYAKFNDNEDIELIVKNKDGNVIYSEIISNFNYFQAFFEKV